MAFNLANTYLKLEKPEEAKNMFNQAMYSENKDARLRSTYNVATDALEKGQPALAIEKLKEYLKEKPEDMDGLHNLEMAYRIKKEQQEQKR